MSFNKSYVIADPRTTGGQPEHYRFDDRPLVFNAKSGYLNSPRHHSIHLWYFLIAFGTTGL